MAETNQRVDDGGGIYLGLGWLAGLIGAWAGLSIAWLRLDEGLLDGEALANLGAAELFWGFTHGEGAIRALLRSYFENFGDYPALFPAAVGTAAAKLGIVDLDGDGPAIVGLMWGIAALGATFAIGRAVAPGDRVERARAGLVAAAILACSPLWGGLQRQLMLENGVCTMVALVAAAALSARRLEVDRGASRGTIVLWGIAGAAAGGALLVKQTAALALVPLATALLVGWGGRDLPWRRRSIGPAVAAAMTAVVAAPWYLPRLWPQAAYLLRSAPANPDAVGPLRQAVFYPMAFLEQAWAPVVLGAFVLLAVVEGRRRPLDPARRRSTLWLGAVVLAMVVVLALIPKKYPRLLLPLLPLVATAAAVVISRWSVRSRAAISVLALASLLVSTFLPGGGLPGLLRPGTAGLLDVDERCFQNWVEPPERPGIPWDGLLDAIAAAGGDHEAVRVGAIAWPVPPCAHQTTLDLGEHLRIRARRAGLEAVIEAGASWDQAGGWPDGPPALLLNEGRLDDVHRPAARGQLGRVVPVWSTQIRSRTWSAELVLLERQDSAP